MKALIKKVNKLFRLLLSGDPVWLKALRFGVGASVEHLRIFHKMEFSTVIDIGANRGQFALLAQHCFKNANITSFEPLSAPAQTFKQVFSNNQRVKLVNAAIGPEDKQSIMHVSACDDSSSLLPISSLQEDKFPGTGEVGTTEVHVAPLSAFINQQDIVGPALLKLDVQGFELDALKGCEPLLTEFDWIYCECSFIELYSGQKLAAEVIDWLSARGFKIKGMYNADYDSAGLSIQADILFQRCEMTDTSCEL